MSIYSDQKERLFRLSIEDNFAFESEDSPKPIDKSKILKNLELNQINEHEDESTNIFISSILQKIQLSEQELSAPTPLIKKELKTNSTFNPNPSPKNPIKIINIASLTETIMFKSPSNMISPHSDFDRSPSIFRMTERISHLMQEMVDCETKEMILYPPNFNFSLVKLSIGKKNRFNLDYTENKIAIGFMQSDVEVIVKISVFYSEMKGTMRNIINDYDSLNQSNKKIEDRLALMEVNLSNFRDYLHKEGNWVKTMEVYISKQTDYERLREFLLNIKRQLEEEKMPKPKVPLETDKNDYFMAKLTEASQKIEKYRIYLLEVIGQAEMNDTFTKSKKFSTFFEKYEVDMRNHLLVFQNFYHFFIHELDDMLEKIKNKVQLGVAKTNQYLTITNIAYKIYQFKSKKLKELLESIEDMEERAVNLDFIAVYEEKMKKILNEKVTFAEKLKKAECKLTDLEDMVKSMRYSKFLSLELERIKVRKTEIDSNFERVARFLTAYEQLPEIVKQFKVLKERLEKEKLEKLTDDQKLDFYKNLQSELKVLEGGLAPFLNRVKKQSGAVKLEMQMSLMDKIFEMNMKDLLNNINDKNVTEEILKEIVAYEAIIEPIVKKEKLELEELKLKEELLLQGNHIYLKIENIRKKNKEVSQKAIVSLKKRHGLLYDQFHLKMENNFNEVVQNQKDRLNMYYYNISQNFKEIRIVNNILDIKDSKIFEIERDLQIFQDIIEYLSILLNENKFFESRQTAEEEFEFYKKHIKESRFLTEIYEKLISTDILLSFIDFFINSTSSNLKPKLLQLSSELTAYPIEVYIQNKTEMLNFVAILLEFESFLREIAKFMFSKNSNTNERKVSIFDSKVFLPSQAIEENFLKQNEKVAPSNELDEKFLEGKRERLKEIFWNYEFSIYKEGFPERRDWDKLFENHLKDIDQIKMALEFENECESIFKQATIMKRKINVHFILPELDEILRMNEKLNSLIEKEKNLIDHKDNEKLKETIDNLREDLKIIIKLSKIMDYYNKIMNRLSICEHDDDLLFEEIIHLISEKWIGNIEYKEFESFLIFFHEFCHRLLEILEALKLETKAEKIDRKIENFKCPSLKDFDKFKNKLKELFACKRENESEDLKISKKSEQLNEDFLNVSFQK